MHCQCYYIIVPSITDAKAMKNKVLLFLLMIFGWFSTFGIASQLITDVTQVSALGDLQCGKFRITHNIPDYFLRSNPNNSFSVTVSYEGDGGCNVCPGGLDYRDWGLQVFKGAIPGEQSVVTPNPLVGPRTVTFNINQASNPGFFGTTRENFALRFLVKDVWGHCPIKDYQVLDDYPIECRDFRVYQERQIDTDGDGVGNQNAWCYAGDNACIDKDINLMVEAKVFRNGAPAVGEVFTFGLPGRTGISCTTDGNGLCKPPNGYGSIGSTGSKQIHLRDLNLQAVCRSSNFTVGSCGVQPELCNVNPTDLNNNTGTQSSDPQPYRLCDQISDSLTTASGENMKQICIECVGGTDDGREGIWTAVGCIPKDPETIVSVVVRLGLGMGGGFALLNILAAGFRLSVSQGNPKQTDEAKQQLTAALGGLLFIIFSVVLLHFIGYTVFKIPGFGEP